MFPKTLAKLIKFTLEKQFKKFHNNFCPKNDNTC